MSKETFHQHIVVYKAWYQNTDHELTESPETVICKVLSLPSDPETELSHAAQIFESKEFKKEVNLPVTHTLRRIEDIGYSYLSRGPLS